MYIDNFCSLCLVKNETVDPTPEIETAADKWRLFLDHVLPDVRIPHGDILKLLEKLTFPWPLENPAAITRINVSFAGRAQALTTRAALWALVEDCKKAYEEAAKPLNPTPDAATAATAATAGRTRRSPTATATARASASASARTSARRVPSSPNAATKLNYEKIRFEEKKEWVSMTPHRSMALWRLSHIHPLAVDPDEESKCVIDTRRGVYSSLRVWFDSIKCSLIFKDGKPVEKKVVLVKSPRGRVRKAQMGRASIVGSDPGSGPRSDPGSGAGSGPEEELQLIGEIPLTAWKDKLRSSELFVAEDQMKSWRCEQCRSRTGRFACLHLEAWAPARYGLVSTKDFSEAVLQDSSLLKCISGTASENANRKKTVRIRVVLQHYLRRNAIACDESEFDDLARTAEKLLQGPRSHQELTDEKKEIEGGWIRKALETSTTTGELTNKLIELDEKLRTSRSRHQNSDPAFQLDPVSEAEEPVPEPPPKRLRLRLNRK